MSKKEKEKISEEAEIEEAKTEETSEAEKESSCENELAEIKDQLLRITAEYANFRKRSEKEKQDNFTFAKSETIRELLPVIDNLERAIASEQNDFEGLKKGVEMTFESLVNTLNKLEIGRAHV